MGGLQLPLPCLSPERVSSGGGEGATVLGHRLGTLGYESERSTGDVDRVGKRWHLLGDHGQVLVQY